MQVKKNVQLSTYTTLNIGGPAAFFVSVTSPSELQEALGWAKKRSIPFFILGGGSNVLFPDEGYSGLVIHISLKGVTYKDSGEEVLVTAAAGELWDALVEEIVVKGLWGLENLSGIPGSVGATPVQNVGAYGVEVARVIEWVEGFDTKTFSTKVFTNKECAFTYRSSCFKEDVEKRYIITRVCYRLSRKGNANMLYQDPSKLYRDIAEYFKGRVGEPTVREVRDAVLDIRKSKFPNLKEIGTAGSFFLNPILLNEEVAKLKDRFPNLPVYPIDADKSKVSVAWILDNILHLKGVQRGAVGAYKNHVLAFVNYGGASSNELRVFADQVKEKVFEETGVSITPEVTIVKN